MAPFELHPAHIDGLVNAGLQVGLISGTKDAVPIGKMLLRQHYRAVGVHRDDDPLDYHLTLADQAFHPIAMLKLLDCYEYQSSGTTDWRACAAQVWMDQLRHAIVARLPAEAKAKVRHGSLFVLAYTLLPAYIETPWGIDTLARIPDIGDGTIVVPIVKKGLRASVLTGPFHSPNGGLSSRVRHVTILGIGEDQDLPALAHVCEPSEDAPGVYLLFEYGRYVARPADAPSGTWFMASGAHLHTSDSRWNELIGHSLPIPLHDRTEP